MFKNILLQPSRTFFSFLQKRLFKFPSSEDSIICIENAMIGRVAHPIFWWNVEI
jgi:hypothetical protein